MMKVLIKTVRTVKVRVGSAWQKFQLCGLKRTKGSGCVVTGVMYGFAVYLHYPQTLLLVKGNTEKYPNF